jgi:hypothetical protein
LLESFENFLLSERLRKGRQIFLIGVHLIKVDKGLNLG